MNKTSGAPDRARKVRLVAILVVVGLAVVVLAHVLAAATAPPSVSVTTVSDGPVVETITATGRVETRNAISVHALVSGIVTEVAVEEGDSVPAGAVMLRIDPRVLVAAVAVREAEVAKARAALARVSAHDVPLANAAKHRADIELENAMRDEERARAMLSEGVISVRDNEAARQALARAEESAKAAALALEVLVEGGSTRLAAEADLMAADAARASARAELSLAQITAATPLVVLNRLTEPGDFVLPGDPLLDLMPLGPTFFVAHLDEVALAIVKPGQPAIATADAVPDQPILAVVGSVAPAVDAIRGTVKVRFRVDEPPSFLRPEMTISVTVEIPRSAGGYAVPIDALVKEGSGLTIYVVREDTVVRVPVDVTLRGPTHVQVRGAVGEGDQVIILPPAGLEAGAAVAMHQWIGREPDQPKAGFRIPFH